MLNNKRKCVIHEITIITPQAILFWELVVYLSQPWVCTTSERLSLMPWVANKKNKQPSAPTPPPTPTPKKLRLQPRIREME